MPPAIPTVPASCSASASSRRRRTPSSMSSSCCGATSWGKCPTESMISTAAAVPFILRCMYSATLGGAAKSAFTCTMVHGVFTPSRTSRWSPRKIILASSSATVGSMARKLFERCSTAEASPAALGTKLSTHPWKSDSMAANMPWIAASSNPPT
uniref:Uncharacterized protein n=1 Tax=Oryza brachyantha TaxID=4533 RepID=J3MAB3_ORYBR